MSWVMRCKCDGCGTWKGEGNNWLLAHVEAVDGLLDESAASFLGFSLWNDDVAQCGDVMHLCGDACKQKMLSEHLAKVKPVEQPEVAPELPVEECSYVPIECEFCGPRCHGGAEHNQRVENGDRYSDGGEI